MELKHIDIANLCVSPRTCGPREGAGPVQHPAVDPGAGRAGPADRAANGGEDRFEIVAGKRRYHAALAVAGGERGGDACPARSWRRGTTRRRWKPRSSRMSRGSTRRGDAWESFTRLVREGRSPEDIALTFGLTELQVKRTLALGNLLPRIRGSTARATSMRHRAASDPRVQGAAARLAGMLDDPEAYCPTGHQLKAWLFGGASIPVGAALFDMAGYDGEIVSDLFGEDSYFADAASFWTAQNAAIEAKTESYREAGWREVIVLPTGETFQSWEHERCPKRKGGKVFLASARAAMSPSMRAISPVQGGAEARNGGRRREAGSARDQFGDPELCRSAPARGGTRRPCRASLPRAAVDGGACHCRFAAVECPGRGSSGQQRAISESARACPSETRFDEKRRAVLDLLGFDARVRPLRGGYDGDHGLAGLFLRLLELPDPALLDVAAVVMGETLQAGSALIEVLGPLLGTDMAKVWQPTTRCST
jgi:ParB family chromosome partitioning protein